MGAKRIAAYENGWSDGWDEAFALIKEEAEAPGVISRLFGDNESPKETAAATKPQITAYQPPDYELRNLALSYAINALGDGAYATSFVLDCAAAYYEWLTS